MGPVKKTEYTPDEKKGFSQARNLGTDRLIKTIQKHGSITGHKVFVNFLAPWQKGVHRCWASENWRNTIPLIPDINGCLVPVYDVSNHHNQPPVEEEPHMDTIEEEEDEIPGSQDMIEKPRAKPGSKVAKKKMRAVCDKCFETRGTKSDPYPGEPWLRCGVPGCRKVNIHAKCSNIKLADCTVKKVLEFCKTFVRCKNHHLEIIDDQTDDEDFITNAVKLSTSDPRTIPLKFRVPVREKKTPKFKSFFHPAKLHTPKSMQTHARHKTLVTLEDIAQNRSKSKQASDFGISQEPEHGASEDSFTSAMDQSEGEDLFMQDSVKLSGPGPKPRSLKVTFPSSKNKSAWQTQEPDIGASAGVDLSQKSDSSTFSLHSQSIVNQELAEDEFGPTDKGVWADFNPSLGEFVMSQEAPKHSAGRLHKKKKIKPVEML